MLHGDLASPDGGRNPYLGLLKRVLTNTLFDSEPDANLDNELAIVHGFIRHYMKSAAISMLPLARMDNLHACIDDVIPRGVPGDFIETGVWPPDPFPAKHPAPLPPWLLQPPGPPKFLRSKTKAGHYTLAFACRAGRVKLAGRRSMASLAGTQAQH